MCSVNGVIHNSIIKGRVRTFWGEASAEMEYKNVGNYFLISV